ncbi:NAD(P)-dependent oxidoreductase [Pseudalkalibacillus sp. A8]|uniref:NAD(P)-dependent oxidoreductase n=1 Tax=Pseudalkalibacillus sp. A8 TaxID=3382641 RepID=UPI0038B4513E
MNVVGVIGCGAMGRGMIKNLILDGHQVLVFDVNPEAVASVEKLGAIPMSSVQAVAEESTYLLLSLPTTILVEDAIIGEEGALKVMKEGSFILDMSTTDVNSTRKIHERAYQKGVSFFDCPVSGGPEGAENGILTVMVGGDQGEFHQVEPVLQAIGKEVKYIGKIGSGQVVKLCHNIVVSGLIVLLSEAFLTGVKAGVPASKIAEVMQEGSAQNRVLSVFGPNLIDGTHENVKFLLSHMLKDIHLYMELASDGQIPTFLGSTINQLYEIADHKGKGQLDSSAVSQVLEELSNLESH